MMRNSAVLKSLSHKIQLSRNYEKSLSLTPWVEDNNVKKTCKIKLSTRFDCRLANFLSYSSAQMSLDLLYLFENKKNMLSYCTWSTVGTSSGSTVSRSLAADLRSCAWRVLLVQGAHSWHTSTTPSVCTSSLNEHRARHLTSMLSTKSLLNQLCYIYYAFNNSYCLTIAFSGNKKCRGEFRNKMKHSLLQSR